MRRAVLFIFGLVGLATSLAQYLGKANDLTSVQKNAGEMANKMPLLANHLFLAGLLLAVIALVMLVLTEDELRRRLIALVGGARLDFGWDPNNQAGRYGEWSVFVHNNSLKETVDKLEVRLKRIQRLDSDWRLVDGRALQRTTSDTHLAPGNSAEFRLVAFTLDDRNNAVRAAPGVLPDTLGALPAAPYVFWVQAFGQGTSPTLETPYLIEFANSGPEVSFGPYDPKKKAPASSALRAHVSTMFAPAPPAAPLPLEMRLKNVFGEYRAPAAAKIVFYSLKQKAAAQRLRSALEHSGWQAQLQSAPLDRGGAEYISGIEIKGQGEAFVTAVVASLQSCGVAAKGVVMPAEIPEGHPKRALAQRYVRVTLGDGAEEAFR